jgi:DNA-binding response OmpR family regulator
MADAEQSAETRGKRQSFDRYVLDLDRGCLLLDGTEIALRPTTFSVLQYLVENPGRLVIKHESFRQWFDAGRDLAHSPDFLRLR